ncbi:hypothetical protein HGI47_05875 [Novosphingobium sp. ERN07]|uniref:hypothetical protein n=1 Tax=Novosphingobium sp. ERN07 TaxID=2726187 RepID=UPI001457764F|nr:hypothetical protein [Novosphingobium sp. ERN07]NLR70399.1 hypothetical protein [Novosphingobium sp. ERN07]
MNISLPKPLIEAYAQAQADFARAAERLALFPEPAVLLAHVRAAEREALAWLEGEVLIPDQLAVDYGYSPRAWRRWPFAFIRVFDRPLPSPTALTAAAVARWINAADLDDPVAQIWRTRSLVASTEHLGGWERRARQTSHLPRLIAAADIAADFTRTAPLTQGNASIAMTLAERHALNNAALSAGGITAIGLKSRNMPWRALVRGNSDDDFDELTETARDARCRAAWLDGLAAGAQTVVKLDRALRIWLERLDTACAGRRSSSHLRALCLLAGAGPSLTAARAAQSLQLSRQATTKLLAQACELRLLREITHGNAFRRYTIDV